MTVMMVEEAVQPAVLDGHRPLDATVADHDGEGESFSACSDSHPPDVRIVTSGGRSIPVHSSALSRASSVLESILLDGSPKRGSADNFPVVPILGVPCNAVSAFLRYVYKSRCTEEEMERYAMHLLVLSHVFRLPALKRACVATLADRIDGDSLVDILQLARLCDAPRLYVRCMKLLAAKFGAVEQTEGWRFLQKNDPWLELDILQTLHEADLREKRMARNRKAQNVYRQLSEAMQCLQHICTEGCTEVGPCDGEPPSRTRGPCRLFRTCQGLQRLIRHYATCEKKKVAVPGGGGGCAQCKRMWQLLRLHASVCDHPEPCRVPLCRQFKLKMQMEKKDVDDGMWRLLVKKVVSAKVMSALASRRPREQGGTTGRHTISG